MRRRERPMNLVMFMAPTGRMASGWRSPTCPVEALWGLETPAFIAERAERARFDAIFLADVLYVLMGGKIGAQPFPTGYEPLTTLSAVAARTSRIGLIGTASTTFIQPFNLARQLSQLDWLSGGRAGWNLVTSQAGQEHFGMELPPAGERYARAEEYLEVVTAFWDAWDDDAVVNDRAAGVWARADRIRPISFEGRWYRAEGQLFQHRSPQGWPVIVQAGQSAAGIDFAARNAEVVFTAQTDIGLAQDYYREIKERAAAAGRDPEAIRVIPGVTAIVGETAADARAFEAGLDHLIDIEVGRQDLALVLQADLTGLDPDEPIPPGLLRDPDAIDVDAISGSRYRNYYVMAVRDRLTMRQIVGINDRAIGHKSVTGSVVEVADDLEEWYEQRACDGFAFGPVVIPEGVETVCDLLIPELQRRGLARTEYAGPTLRENLGLPRPPSPRPAGR